MLRPSATSIMQLGACVPCGVGSLGALPQYCNNKAAAISYAKSLETLRTSNPLLLVQTLQNIGKTLAAKRKLAVCFQNLALDMLQKYPGVSQSLWIWLADMYLFNANKHEARYASDMGYRYWWRGQLLRRYYTARNEFDYLVNDLNTKLKTDAALRDSVKKDLAQMAAMKYYFAELAGFLKKQLPNLNITTAPALPSKSAVRSLVQGSDAATNQKPNLMRHEPTGYRFWVDDAMAKHLQPLADWELLRRQEPTKLPATVTLPTYGAPTDTIAPTTPTATPTPTPTAVITTPPPKPQPPTIAEIARSIKDILPIGLADSEITEQYKFNVTFRQQYRTLLDKQRTSIPLQFINNAKRLNSKIGQSDSLRKYYQADLLELWRSHPELAKAFYTWLSKLYTLTDDALNEAYRTSVGVRRWWRGYQLYLSKVSPQAFLQTVSKLNGQLRGNTALQNWVKADLADMRKNHFADLADATEKRLSNLRPQMAVAPSVPVTTEEVMQTVMPVESTSTTVTYTATPPIAETGTQLYDETEEITEGPEVGEALEEKSKTEAEDKKASPTFLMFAIPATVVGGGLLLWLNRTK